MAEEAQVDPVEIEPDPLQIEEEVIAAFAKMSEALVQKDAAEKIGSSGLASCGGETGTFVKQAKREAADAMKAATYRLEKAQAAYLKQFGHHYVPPKPPPTPPSAKKKSSPEKGKRKGGYRGRKPPWRKY